MASVPEFQRSDKAAKSAAWMANSTVAYTYVGLNYTAEVLWDVSVGTVAVVALCGPVILAATSSHTHGNLQCIPVGMPIKKLVSPPLGRNAWEKTHDMRCPNVEPLVESLEKVARCFEKRNTELDRKLAIATLNNIENSKYFYACVSPSISDRIAAKRVELEAQITKKQN